MAIRWETKSEATCSRLFPLTSVFFIGFLSASSLSAHKVPPASVGLTEPPITGSGEKYGLAQAAEFYFKNREFPRALELYRQLVEQDARVPRYWERATMLALYVEGRSSAHELAVKYLGNLGQGTVAQKRGMDSLEAFLSALYGTFVTDRGQGLYLQGKVRSERGDCHGALGFFKQALDIESTQLQVLRSQVQCLERLGNLSQEYDVLKAVFNLNPLLRPVAERLAEMHHYFGNPSLAMDVVEEYSKFKSATSRLLVAEAVALARKADRELAWQTFRKVDASLTPAEVPAIVYWEKAKLLETDRRRKSPLAKSQLVTWLTQYLKRVESPPSGKGEVRGAFDLYGAASFQEEAKKWLSSLKESMNTIGQDSKHL